MMPSPPTATISDKTPTGLGEALATWALCAFVAVEVFVTQSRLPAADLYHPASSGISEGGYALLSFTGFAGALVALAILPIIFDRVRARTVAIAALVAGVLAGSILWPGAIHEADIDVSSGRILPALGAGLMLILTIDATRRVGTGDTWRRQRGDVARIGLGAVLVCMGLPWMAADLGLSLNLPGLHWLYQTDQLRSQPGVPGLHEAVHEGHHHGMNGVLLAAAALILSRALPRVHGGRLRHALAGYLALLLAYGFGNAVQDFWLEQIVKRGLTSFQLPMVLTPALNWGCAAVLLAAVAVYALAFRPLAFSGDETPRRRWLLPGARSSSLPRPAASA